MPLCLEVLDFALLQVSMQASVLAKSLACGARFAAYCLLRPESSLG